MTIKTQRPRYLNLLKIRLPITGVASILHRLSGVLLVVAIPFIIYGLALSLRSAEDLARLEIWINSAWMRMVMPLWVWAITHHLLTGIRFLLMDIGIGQGLAAARLSAWWVSAIAGTVFLLVLFRGVVL